MPALSARRAPDAESGGQREVQTPHMDELVATGINLNQHYTFKFCSPTRSALQSGRNPIHVNVQNVGPDRSNPAVGAVRHEP